MSKLWNNNNNCDDCDDDNDEYYYSAKQFGQFLTRFNTIPLAGSSKLSPHS